MLGPSSGKKEKPSKIPLFTVLIKKNPLYVIKALTAANEEAFPPKLMHV